MVEKSDRPVTAQPPQKSLQNWSAEHCLGMRLWIFRRAEAVLGAPNPNKTAFANISYRRQMISVSTIDMATVRVTARWKN